LVGFFYMSNFDLVLFDDIQWQQLFPLTLSRPTSAIRIGMSTIADKWKQKLGGKDVFYHTEDYLKQRFVPSSSSQVQLVNGAVLPAPDLISAIQDLPSGTLLKSGDINVALQTDFYNNEDSLEDILNEAPVQQIGSIELLNRPEDILRLNDIWIERDFQDTEGGILGHIDEDTKIIGSPDRIHIGIGATVHAQSINTTDGPVYIGKDVLVMEGAMLRGPLVIYDRSVIKMGAKIYGKTSIGNRCKVGGEVKRVVIHCHSNKGHDGYLGDSVIGEWCNLGADSNNSNMKNTYGKVNLYDIADGHRRRTEEQFLGLFMGDHCRCAINTQFNTGTVAAYFANIFGAPPSTYIKPFQWGEDKVYDLEKAIEVARTVYDRRSMQFTSGNEAIMRYLYQAYR